jgi:alpha-D-xyloside xylohydrolase
MQSGRLQLIDFTNPEAANWWGENGPAKMAKMGIKGFKLDRADGEMEVDSLHLITNAGTSYRENYNDYPRQFIKTTYDALKPVLGDNFILFPRALYTGSAKYGAMWAGDIRGEAEAFRAAIIAVQRCAVMGYPLWGADIGGYHGFYRAIVMKWLGFGCFAPIMEVGPTENRGFWDNANAPTYDTALIATWRLYAKTRMKLVPYIKSLATEAHNTGTPIARPLFLEYPSQPEAWKDWQTYLLGTDILVSVIWEEGKNEQNVYLPGGETWIDAWDTGKEYKGGQYLKVTTKPYQIPLFIRKGSTLNLGDLNALYQESYLKASKKGNLAELEAAEGWR